MSRPIKLYWHLYGTDPLNSTDRSCSDTRPLCFRSEGHSSLLSQEVPMTCTYIQDLQDSLSCCGSMDIGSWHCTDWSSPTHSSCPGSHSWYLADYSLAAGFRTWLPKLGLPFCSMTWACQQKASQRTPQLLIPKYQVLQSHLCNATLPKWYQVFNVLTVSIMAVDRLCLKP